MHEDFLECSFFPDHKSQCASNSTAYHHLVALAHCRVFSVVLKQFLKLDNEAKKIFVSRYKDIVIIDVMKIGLKDILMFQ